MCVVGLLVSQGCLQWCRISRRSCCEWDSSWYCCLSGAQTVSDPVSCILPQSTCWCSKLDLDSFLFVCFSVDTLSVLGLSRHKQTFLEVSPGLVGHCHSFRSQRRYRGSFQSRCRHCSCHTDFSVHTTAGRVAELSLGLPHHPQLLGDPKQIINTVLANNEERNKLPKVKLVLILRLRNKARVSSTLEASQPLAIL